MANFSLFSEKPPRSMDEFEFLQDPRDKNSRLGIGSFATVKLAREKKTGRLVALKIVDLENSKNKASDLHNLRIEVHVHKRISHDNIIKYHGYFTEKNMVYIILDYAEKGNLYGYIHKKRVLSPEEIFRFFYQTCLSIEYLHQQDVMHRDIKPENLLLDKDINIKLCDLGWCAERIKDKRTTFCGTYEYMAPEIVYKKQYDYKVDIWSLGVLLYELIHKEAPYKGRSLNEILNSLTKTTMTFSPSIDPQARDLIVRILRVNPSERPSIREILSHPWVMYNLRLNEHSANGFSSVRSNVLASRENQNLKAMSRDRSEKHIQNIAQIYNKNKKASQAAAAPKDASESAKREGHEEQGSEIYYKSNPKPSSSLCKNPLELDIEERKELNRRRNIYMSRNAELKRQGSLSSAITGSTMTPLSGQHSNDSNMSILPGTSNAKRNVIGLQTPNAVESTYQVGISAVAGSFSNNLVAKEQQIGSLKSLSNIGSVNSLDSIGPEPTNGVSPSAIPKLNKIRTQTGPGLHPLMNARPGGTPNALEMLYSTGVTTTRLPSHQKALSIINESGLSRRLVTDNHTGSMPIQVRQLNNGSVNENQKYPNLMGATSENIKAINKGMKGIISPVAWSGRRIFIKSRGDINGKSKENNAIEQYQSIENKKGKSPSIDYDIRGPETQEIVNIPGSNFAGQLDSKDNLIITPAEDFGAVKLLKRLTKEKRSVNKENRILLDGSLNGLEGVDKAKNRIEFHYRSNYN